MKPKKLQVLLVHWLDAFVQETNEDSYCEQVSTGLLVSESKRFIKLAQTFDPDGADPRDVLVIPMGMVLDRVVLWTTATKGRKRACRKRL